MNMETIRHSQILYSCQTQKTLYHYVSTHMSRLHSQISWRPCDMLWFWTSLSKVAPLYVLQEENKTVCNDPLRNLQEVTTRREDVYFIVWQPGHAVTVNKAVCCICHNLFLYFCLKVSVCPERGVFTVRALFKSKSPDERWEEHFKCQQTMFLTCYEECSLLSIELVQKLLKVQHAHGGWREAEDSIHDRPQSQIIPLLLCSPEKL